MRDFTQRGTFVQTYWKQTKAAPDRPEWTVFDTSNDKALGSGPDHAAALVAAQDTLRTDPAYKGRFI